MQNNDGGYASYELVRGPKWLEWLNAAEVFGMLLSAIRAIEVILTIHRGYHD